MCGDIGRPTVCIKWHLSRDTQYIHRRYSLDATEIRWIDREKNEEEEGAEGEEEGRGIRNKERQGETGLGKHEEEGTEKGPV